MPLFDVKCKNGHVEEVLVRGVNMTPLACSTCSEPVEKLPSVFHARGVVVPEPEPPSKVSRNRPKYVKRMGEGIAYKNEYGNYRPALTHTARCPQEKRRRNVAVLGELPYGLRLNCEACGYQWIHQEKTAGDPLIRGYDSTLSPGKKFSGFVSPGDQYVTPERGA